MPEKSSSENSETLKLWNSETLKLENYFLSFARLSPPKRVDMIVDAFLEMPEKNLILTYGKNDPMKDAIFAKIRGRKNILALESPDDNELIDLIQWAIATIYIPVDEDFGMSPVESMACGTPVIGVNEGWLRETIVDGKTGFLIDFSPENLKKSIQNMTLEIAQSLHQECILHVNHFSLQTFECKLLQYLK